MTPTLSQLDSKKYWREKYGLTMRLSRPSWYAIWRLLKSSRKTKIFLRENAHTTDIVLRFRVNSQSLLPRAKEIFADSGLKMKDIFGEILGTLPPRGESTLRAQLTRVGNKAYREAWIHYIRMLYLDRSYPIVDKALANCLKNFKILISERGLAINRQECKDFIADGAWEFSAKQIEFRKGLSTGRRELVKTEKKGLERRYEQLLKNSLLIHEIAETATEKHQRPERIGKAIQKLYVKKVDDTRGENKIFGGKAFEIISHGRKSPTPELHNPRSWKPYQLAIALLALERSQEYDTIKRKIRPTKFTSS